MLYENVNFDAEVSPHASCGIVAWIKAFAVLPYFHSPFWDMALFPSVCYYGESRKILGSMQYCLHCIFLFLSRQRPFLRLFAFPIYAEGYFLSSEIFSDFEPTIRIETDI